MAQIFISAGELSGDEHAAGVVRSIKERLPSAKLFGMAGKNMREAGVEAVAQQESEASVMGFVDVIKKLPSLAGTLSRLKAELRTRKPDLAVFVDYPDFNFMLAAEAKRLGIKTLFFVSPTVWAWRSGRVRTVAKLIDTMATIFPFEPEFYRERGYQGSVYVGHPFAQEFASDKGKGFSSAELRSELSLDSDNPILALLPGSRRGEIERCGTVLGELARKASVELSTEVVVPIAPSLGEETKQLLSSILGTEAKLTTLEAIKVMQAADIGVIKSGTSNMQAAFCELPFLMFYKTNRMTELVVRTMSKRREFSIANIIRSGTIEEFYQDRFKSKLLLAECERLLKDETYRTEKLAAIRAVKSDLQGFDDLEEFKGTQSSYERVAVLAQELLKK